MLTRPRLRDRRVYLVAILAAAATMGALAVSAPAAAPSNDDFAAATRVGTLPFHATQSTVDATAAADDPTCGTVPLTHTVWFSFTAPTNGSVRIDTQGTDYVIDYSVYTGTRGAFTCVGRGTTVTSIAASAGTTYFLMVGTEAHGGTLVVDISVSPAVHTDPTGTVDRAGVATISGTITCPAGTDFASASGSLLERHGTRSSLGPIGFGIPPTSCTGTPVAWTATVSSGTGVPFGRGEALVRLHAQAGAYGPPGFFETQDIQAVVQLHRG